MVAAETTRRVTNMNYENPPPYSGVNPTAPYTPYGQPQGGPGPTQYPGYPPGQPGYPPMQPGYPAGQPGYPTGQPGYPVGQPGYQGNPQYGWQGGQPPAPVYMEAPKNTVYVVEERRDNSGESACLTACWTALCCCCLWDMLT